MGDRPPLSKRPVLGAAHGPDPVKRGGTLRRRRRSITKAEREAHDRFRGVVCSEPCLWSLARPGHECDGPLDPHHCIEAQYLRQRFPGRWDIIFDPALGVPLCRAAHDPVTWHSDYIYWDELPLRVIVAAVRHGIDHRLQMESPAR